MTDVPDVDQAMTACICSGAGIMYRRNPDCPQCNAFDNALDAPYVVVTLDSPREQLKAAVALEGEWPEMVFGDVMDHIHAALKLLSEKRWAVFTDEELDRLDTAVQHDLARTDATLTQLHHEIWAELDRRRS